MCTQSHSVCTLIMRSLSNGALRKGLATEKSAMAFHSFAHGHVAKGLLEACLEEQLEPHLQELLEGRLNAPLA